MIQEDLQSYTSPFLFREYTPKQAQMPVMQRTTPKKRAIASPASTASTTGSTKSSEMRTNNCAETEVMMLGPWDGWILSSEGFLEIKHGNKEEPLKFPPFQITI